MHQDATWYGGRPQPRGLRVRWGPSPLNVRHMFIIVIVISLEHFIMHSRYWFVQIQVQVLVLCAFYTVSQKKGATLTMAVTLSIFDRFAKFFHYCKDQ